MIMNKKAMALMLDYEMMFKGTGKIPGATSIAEEYKNINDAPEATFAKPDEIAKLVK